MSRDIVESPADGRALCSCLAGLFSPAIEVVSGSADPIEFHRLHPLGRVQIMTRNSQGIVDPLDFGPVLEAQERPGTKLTFTVPTDVTGQDDGRAALTLKNQLRDAKAQLVESGMRDPVADDFLAPVAELLDDSSYWRLQSRGLVVFLTDGFFQPVRVPIEVDESLTVGDEFWLLPLAPVLATDRKLYVLALAKNSVRLFDATRNTIEELPLKNVPGSFDEVVDELPERAIDIRPASAGPAGTASHHGPSGDIDRVLLEKYVHAVGQAIGTRLGTARSQQLVLAAVAEYLPLFKAACPYPAIFDGVVRGNPEHATPDELRSAAWRLVEEHEAAREAEEQDHARSVIHGGGGSFDLAEIARAAAEGRVDTLYLPRDVTRISADGPRENANRALIAALKSGGALRTLGQVDNEGFATFRY